MFGDAAQLLAALEQSALGAGIRQSPWAYPAANVGHILALTLFSAAIAVMDLRILGAFAATPPHRVIYPARRMAAVAFTLMVITGLSLFIPEASHVSMNRVFQFKLALIALGLLNAVVLAGPALSNLADVPPNTALSARARAAAILSLAIWLCIAASGRMIAYY